MKIVNENIENDSSLNNKNNKETDPNEYLLAHYLSNGSKKNIKYSKSEHQIHQNNKDKSQIQPRKDKNGQLIVVII